MRYRDDLTPAEIDALLSEAAALDRAYADAAVERAESERDAEALETEADLYRYWRP